MENKDYLKKLEEIHSKKFKNDKNYLESCKANKDLSPKDYKIQPNHKLDEYFSKYGKKLEKGKLLAYKKGELWLMNKNKKYWEIKNDSDFIYFEVSSNLKPLWISLASLAAVTGIAAGVYFGISANKTPPTHLTDKYIHLGFLAGSNEISGDLINDSGEIIESIPLSMYDNNNCYVPTYTLNVKCEILIENYEVDNLWGPTITKRYPFDRYHEPTNWSEGTFIFGLNIGNNFEYYVTAPDYNLDNTDNYVVKLENCSKDFDAKIVGKGDTFTAQFTLDLTKFLHKDTNQKLPLDVPLEDDIYLRAYYGMPF